MSKEDSPNSRKPSGTRSAGQILKGSNHILHSLYAQSREIKSIEKVVERYIDDEFAISSFKNNNLTLICPSGATASKLRYRQRTIQSNLKRAGLDVKSIQIKVQPINEFVKTAEVERTLSDQGAAQLVATADDITDDALRQALIKLSKRNFPD